MKKLFPLSLLLAATMCTTQADAQVKLGVKGGLNVSSMSFSEDVFNSSNRTGWFAGPTVKFTLPIVGLSFDASALYNQTSAKIEAVDGPGVEETIKQKTVEVPVNVRLGLGLGDAANIFVFGGPQFGFNVGDDEFKWDSSSSLQNTFQLKKSTISVNVGGGVTLNHLQITANYNIACGKTGEVTSISDTMEGAYHSRKDKGRNNNWQIGLAYFF